MATGMFENDTPGNCLQQQPPGVPDSPDSIPLPDSPPPEAEERVVVGGAVGGDVARDSDFPPEEEAYPDGENNNSDAVLNNMPLYSSTSSGRSNPSKTQHRKGGRKPRLAEEYDPSEPLTSSDEEEHSILLVEGGRTSSRNSNSGINTHKETNSSGSNSASVLESKITTSPPRPYRISTTPPPLAISKTPFTSSSGGKFVEQKSTSAGLIGNMNINSGSSNSTINFNINNNASSSGSSSRLDLSSIPVPPEENRRPVIHFSIPTRHRLLPISSLMKRQKGTLRKDGRGVDGVAGQQADGYKGSEKSQDGDDDDEEEEMEDGNRGKISLVAEIFGGTDDEDDENEDESESAQQQQQQILQSAEDKIIIENDESALAVQNNGYLENESQQHPNPIVEANSGRWKLVADEPINNLHGENNELVISAPLATSEKENEQQPPNVSQTEESTANDLTGEDEPEIIEIVTLNVPPTSRLRPLRRRPFMGRFGLENGGEPEVIDIDKDEDEQPAVEFNTPAAPAAPAPAPLATEDRNPHRSSISPPRRSSSGLLDISTNSENEKEKRLSRSSPGESSPARPERHFKRPHSSSSMSNCEEGEIIDQVNPNKKRKKDKKKKTKRRKRSKDSISPPPSSSKLPDKRLPDSIPPPASTSDHEENDSSRGGGGAISWRKPSKRTQNRNYRDGKPKADDTFFREKEVEEKQKSSSPSHRRNRAASSRKERSPVKEKSSSGRHRRDGSPRNNRSHSKSPAGRASRSRSRSSGRPYRSRRRNRHSRSRSSNSVSDKSKSARSSSRRRSRRRYRRSTSRHHAGDSRSPSYITEPIRSRSSHYSKLRGRSRTRSRDRHGRGRHRNKRSVTRSRTPSPRSHKKNRKPESIDRQQRKKQIKEKERHQQQQQQQQVEEPLSDTKDKRKEKEKLKEKEKRKKKEKEKPKEEEKSKPPKEKPKEKEKKKKKKRREKSPTPVKAIVADGDSIVVSLSFQKGKTTTSASNTQPPSASIEDRKENGLDTSENSESHNKPKPTTPTNNASGNDATEESSAFNEEQERTQSSPAKLSSVTDEEASTSPTDPNATERSAKPTKPDERETEAAKVTSSGGGSCGSNSPFDTERSFNAAPDSTKTVTPQSSEQQDSSFNHSLRSSVSPTTDGESNVHEDSLVTSTGDSMDPATHGAEDEAKSNMCSTPSKQQSDSNKLFSGLTPHKTGTSGGSPRAASQTSSASSENSIAIATTTSTSAASSCGSMNSSTMTNSSQSSVTPTMTRPLIGNIPGLYPSSAIISSGGAAPVPPPIVIPTPPPPRAVQYTNTGGQTSSTPMLNPNVLASVASALLAVRQNQPSFSGKLQAASNSSDTAGNNSTQLRHFNVLGPKSQNFSLQSNFRGGLGNNSSFSQGQDNMGGGGESPMSPNSSEGDDLFEPPTDSQSEGGKIGKNGQLFGGMPIMVGGTANANDSFNSTSSGSQPKERNNLFDSLFGGTASTPKKTVANKPEKVTKSKAKHRKGGPKKETIKVNTSGGLTEGELRLTDEVPTSAVELIVKQKYLKKLNRQERVVEEVKVALKPYYSKRQVNKDEYKEILRRAVPKICHNKTGEINPGKIKELVEAYVKKFRHARKRGLDLSSVK